jgi:ParB/RepB/Spo0J family partition protein
MNAPAILTLDLASLDANGPYQQRRTRASAEADAGLAESIRAMGVLQPILVRRDDATGQHQVVDGHRRAAAARAAGLATIAAIEVAHDERMTMAAGIAANMQRAPLAPVDQWRAIVHLQSLGWTLDGAAAALGVSLRAARKLDKLGRLHPDMLAAIEKGGMPDDEELAAIASAPHDVQAQALKAKNAWPSKSEPNWWIISGACEVTRISRQIAIFNPDKVEGITWEEDLFAEPGAKDAITTLDIDAFVEAQHAALVARAQRWKKLHVAEWDAKRNGPKVPAGWTVTWDTKRAGAEVWAAVKRSGYGVGEIVQVHALPPASPAKGSEAGARKESPPDSALMQTAGADATTDTAEDDNHRAEDDTPEDLPRGAATPAKVRPPLTEKGRILLAAEKTAAIRAALRDRRDHHPADILAVLVLALAGDNVRVHADPKFSYRAADFRDLAARLLNAEGGPEAWATENVLPIAAEAAARMIVCAPTGLSGNASGDAAEWIGAAIGAERDLPRLDTAELLACVSGDALRAIDVQRGGTGKGTTKAIRERLVGHAEDLRLPGSAFAAEVPELVEAEDTDAGEGFATCDGCDEPEDCRAAGKCWAESEVGGDGR